MRQVAIFVSFLGCACVTAPDSREMAVTVTDATEMECEGVAHSPAIDQSSIDAIARDLERSYENQREVTPPKPQGRTLRVNQTDQQTQAWFDHHPGDGMLLEHLRFDGANVVFTGPANDEFIEGSYAAIFNTDEQDKDAGREECGDRAFVSGTLTLTDVKGIRGRIRWIEHTYIESVTSACAGTIDCVRDVAVDGLELP